MNDSISLTHFSLSFNKASRALRKARYITALFFFAVQCFPVYATVYNVTTTTDGTTANTLRGAITAADASAGPHTINVPAGTYNLTLGEITFGNRAQNITISGAGSANTVINMTTTNQDRIFYINPPGTIAGIQTTITGIKFTNGHLKTDTYGGGAIIAGGPGNSLTITGCIFQNNIVDAGLRTTGGGAIRFTGGGALTIDQCTFSNNTSPATTTNSSASGVGGAISFEAYSFSVNGVYTYPDNSLSVTNSIFSGNTAGSYQSLSGQGGAINVSASGFSTVDPPRPTLSVTIRGNSFIGNSVTGTGGRGGAISATNSFSPTNTFLINYNRFFGNTAGSGFGTALLSFDTQGNVDATNNWWGCNSGPTSCADKAYRYPGSSTGTLTTTPYLQLRTSAANTTLCTGAATTITSRFTINSAGTTIPATNLGAFTGIPISFSATGGTLSNQQTTIQSTGTATATYTPATTGTGTVNAIIDNVPASDVTARASMTINAGPTVTNPANATTCAGTTVSFSVTGSGSGTLSYQWYRGNTPLVNGGSSSISGATSTTLTISNPGTSDAATDYNVRVSVTTGCTATSANASLSVNARPATPSVSVTQPTCSIATGIIIIDNPTGAGITYSINNTNYQSGNTFNNVTSGNYNVTAKSSSGCVSSSFPVTINAQPATPATPTVSIIQPTCTVATATITVSTPTGTGITYSINGSTYQSGNIFNNVASGNYNVTAKNSGGCVSSALPVTINPQPATPATPTVSVIQPTCSTPTATITFNTPNGSGITYSINGSAYQASNVFSSVTPGSYNVTARNSSNCTSAALPLTINAQPATPATPTVTVIQPTCSVATGTITVNTPNGSGITYSISGSTYQSGSIFNNVTPGNYNVTAKNSSGCVSAALPVTINAAPATPVIPTVNVIQPTCTVATGTITITNPTGITYSINGSTYQSGNIFNNVIPGNYNVTAKNSSGCVSVALPITINAQPATPATPTAGVIQPTCTVATGTITVTNPIGGGSTYSINGTDYQSSVTFNNVVPGNYNVTAKNSSGCVSAAAPVTITAAPATPATPMVSVIQPTCTVTTGTITVTNPIGAGITYSINGSTYQSSNTFSNVAPGNYSVTVRNSSNCTSAATPVTINAAPASPATPTVSITHPTCSTPTGTITINNPTGAGITYSIGSTYQSSTTFNNVTPGTYNVTAKNGSCVSLAATAVINAQPTDNQPPSIPSQLTVFLNVSGQANLTPASVAPLITDNCAVNPNSITVSANSFTCANINTSGSHQAYVANTSFGNQPFQGEIGMDFTVNNPNGIQVNQLGAFDHQSNGITGTQSGGVRVAIFNKATQAIVPGLNVVISGSTDPLVANHRMKNIPPVTLMLGNYVIVAKGYSAAELNGNVSFGGGPFAVGDNGSGAITYTNRISWGNDNPAASFDYPLFSTTASTNEYLAGSFNYAIGSVATVNSVTVNASDMTGNNTTVNAIVTVVDTFYTIVTRNITVNLDATGHATIQPSDVLVSLKNNCGATITSSTLQISPSSFDCSNVYGAAAIDRLAYVSNTSTGNQAYLGEIGMDFTVNNANGIQVNQLGAFDHQANGITGTQSGGVRVAIFNRATQTIVPGLDIVIVGNADELLSNHRMKNITPVILAPGNYVIVVKGYSATELNGNAGLGGGPFANGDNGGGAITYTNRISWGANNSFPSFSYPANAQAGSTNEYHAGTFSYTTTPVPGTRVMLKATDVYGNVDSMTAMVTVENPNNSCSTPVIAGSISPAKPPIALMEVSKLSVYPNPSNGVFNVLLSHFGGSKMSIEITDGNGKLLAVKVLTLNSKIPVLTVPFDLGSKAVGMYWIKAVSATGVQTAKLLLQR